MKKIIAVILSLILLILHTFTANADVNVTVQYGDVNLSSSVNGKDATLLMQYINGWEFDVFITAAADVNVDDKINNKDYILLVRYINGWDVELGVTVPAEPNKNINPDGIEIYGSGTADDPYLDTPNADTHTIKTLSIPAGKSVFYSIYRAGGKILTINSNDAYVVCDGTKHTAQNGVLSFRVADALASDAVSFEIGNTGSAEANFTITFSDLEGSMANPTVIKTIDTEVSLDLAEGNEVGHFYKYITEQSGALKLYLLSGTEKGILLATNNRNSAQRSTESSEEGEVKSDDVGTYIELEVQKGDEIVIHVGAKPNKRGKYPAVTIEWMLQYTIAFDNWDLVFEDDFNGTELNTDVWNVWDEKRDIDYAYSKQNSFLDGKGNLVNRMSLLEEPDPVTGQTKLTSVIETNDKFETTYGYFEIRMIPRRAMGLVGAFWLNCGDMSNDDAPKDNTAVNGCEIDIVETFYHTKTPAQTIHWDGYGWYQDENDEWQTVTKTKSLYVPPMENIFDGNYHTFSLLWSPEEYVFLVDGEVTNRTDVMGICNQPGYILISSHFNTSAGELPLKPGEHTDMIVDYVRVYKNESME